MFVPNVYALDWKRTNQNSWSIDVMRSTNIHISSCTLKFVAGMKIIP